MLDYGARNGEFVWVAICGFGGGFDEGLEDCVLEGKGVTDQADILSRFPGNGEGGRLQ